MILLTPLRSNPNGSQEVLHLVFYKAIDGNAKKAKASKLEFTGFIVLLLLF